LFSLSYRRSTFYASILFESSSIAYSFGGKKKNRENDVVGEEICWKERDVNENGIAITRKKFVQGWK
jgi:hypothetical protein